MSADYLAARAAERAQELKDARKQESRLRSSDFTNNRADTIRLIATLVRAVGIQGLSQGTIELVRQTLMSGEIQHVIVCAKDGSRHGHLLYSAEMQAAAVERERAEREAAVEEERAEQERRDRVLKAGPKPEGRLIRSPRDAELAAEEWMRYFGFGDAEVTPVGADEGIDVDSTRAVAQVKAYMVPVGRPDVQNLAGVAAAEGKIGIFFALNGYTPQAIQWADKANIALFSFDLQGEPEAVNKAAHKLMP